MTIIEPQPDSAAIAEDFGAMGQTFRGEIWEDDADNPILAEFLQCYFHRPILRAANLPTTRRIVIAAANQIGKSRIGELVMKHRIKHDPGDMVLYDITKEMSDDHMKTRFMPLLKSIPEVGRIISEVEANNRFDVTTTDIQLPGMVLRGRPLNEQWTQRITVRYGLISDAVLAERNGQIRRAFIRSTQHEGEELWVVESQGGIEGDDFTQVMKETDEAELHVACPHCGGVQAFVWHREREEDFRARLPRETVLAILRKYGCEQQIDEVMNE